MFLFTIFIGEVWYSDKRSFLSQNGWEVIHTKVYNEKGRDDPYSLSVGVLYGDPYI